MNPLPYSSGLFYMYVLYTTIDVDPTHLAYSLHYLYLHVKWSLMIELARVAIESGGTPSSRNYQDKSNQYQRIYRGRRGGGGI